MTATAARATCASFSHCVRAAESRKSPQNSDFYGHRTTYSEKAHCIKDSVLLDPSCGTAGFLVASEEWLWENRKEEIFYDKDKKDHFMNHMFTGFDMDRTMLRIGAMNMMTHGVDNPFIEYRDSLSDQNPDADKFSLILANPPFKGSLDYDIVSAYILKVCKTKKQNFSSWRFLSEC